MERTESVQDSGPLPVLAFRSCVSKTKKGYGPVVGSGHGQVGKIGGDPVLRRTRGEWVEGPRCGVDWEGRGPERTGSSFVPQGQVRVERESRSRVDLSRRGSRVHSRGEGEVGECTVKNFRKREWGAEVRGMSE